ncbi:MAG TPA: hypothetical protein VLA73_06695 [Burkholderiales bacterium]|nr:hypothetical protein [Burkholderiales bacterium]
MALYDLDDINSIQQSLDEAFWNHVVALIERFKRTALAGRPKPERTSL